jgi:transcriptional regulator with XRE-family HTH domain
MPRATIDVDVSLVRWARESAGLSVQAAAKKVGVKPDKFELWETAGVPERPTATQLERLADAVKRPVATFFLPEPPAEPPLPADFRKPPTAKAPAPLSYAVRLAIRRARRLQQSSSAEGGQATEVHGSSPGTNRGRAPAQRASFSACP